MRQAVTARGLALSAPAPSPSKRPKRAAPQVPPQELARLADKQLSRLRALLAGTEHPYPGPCGLEEPVSAVVKFFKETHSAWAAVRLSSLSLGFAFAFALAFAVTLVQRCIRPNQPYLGIDRAA